MSAIGGKADMPFCTWDYASMTMCKKTTASLRCVTNPRLGTTEIEKLKANVRFGLWRTLVIGAVRGLFHG